jgi:hypothetical protein
VLLKQLELKLSKIGDATTERVRTAKIAQLDRWVERIHTAASLDEVLAS